MNCFQESMMHMIEYLILYAFLRWNAFEKFFVFNTMKDLKKSIIGAKKTNNSKSALENSARQEFGQKYLSL